MIREAITGNVVRSGEKPQVGKLVPIEDLLYRPWNKLQTAPIKLGSMLDILRAQADGTLSEEIIAGFGLGGLNWQMTTEPAAESVAFFGFREEGVASFQDAVGSVLLRRFYTSIGTVEPWSVEVAGLGLGGQRILGAEYAVSSQQAVEVNISVKEAEIALSSRGGKAQLRTWGLHQIPTDAGSAGGATAGIITQGMVQQVEGLGSDKTVLRIYGSRKGYQLKFGDDPFGRSENLGFGVSSTGTHHFVTYSPRDGRDAAPWVVQVPQRLAR